MGSNFQVEFLTKKQSFLSLFVIVYDSNKKRVTFSEEQSLISK